MLQIEWQIRLLIAKKYKKNGNEAMDSIVITNPRNQEVTAGQVYKDKSLLKNVTSFYAISINF